MQVGVCLPINPEKLEGLKTRVKDLGAEFVEGNHFALSTMEQKDFDKIIAFTREINLPINCTNAFLGKMNIFDSPELLKQGEEYVKRSFERFSKTDLKHITFGSGVSRAATETRSVEDTKKIFADFCYTTVAPLAKDYGYLIGIEPLNSGETNTFNTAAETFEFLKELNIPNVKMIIDYFHFTKENENPADILKYKGYVSHFHIASKTNRTSPVPQDNETESYKAFLDIASQIADENTSLAIEGSIVAPLNESIVYLNELLGKNK